jgi:hypothetical protein
MNFPLESRAQKSFLNLLVDETLFGSAEWPPDPNSLTREMKSFRSCLTASGELGLFGAWVGIWDLAEIPGILMDFSLCSQAEADLMWDILEGKGGSVESMRALLQRSYRQWFGQQRDN